MSRKQPNPDPPKGAKPPPPPAPPSLESQVAEMRDELDARRYDGAISIHQLYQLVGWCVCEGMDPATVTLTDAADYFDRETGLLFPNSVAG